MLGTDDESMHSAKEARRSPCSHKLRAVPLYSFRRQRKEHLRGENSSEKVGGGNIHFLARRTIESRLRCSQIYFS